jgi:hypothetical protein
MTEMQILRNAMFDEIVRLKRRTTTPQESIAVVKAANTIISSYNTELKAVSLIVNLHEYGKTVPELKIFIEDHKNELDFKANDREE